MKFNLRRVVQLWVLVGAAITTSSSYGAMTNKMLLDVLLENGAINPAQYEKLLAGSKEEEKKSADDVQISLDSGHLKFKTKDGDFKFQVGGRVMADAAWFKDDNRTLGDGTEIRRARLFLSGTIWEDWHFKGQYDFAGNQTRVKDAYLKHTGLSRSLGFPLDITVGHFKEPFMLDELTSSKYITFMERSLPTEAFSTGRNLGIAAKSYGKALDGGWTVETGFFGSGVDDRDDGTDESYGWAGRATFAPIATKDKVVHIGASFEYRKLKDIDVTVRARPESHIADKRLVSATITKADDVLKYGVEAAAVWGPISAQAEYIAAYYDAAMGSSADFDGYYAYVSGFLTGESRKYDAKSGFFGRVKPRDIVGKGGWGAWELASRFSYVDLNDGIIKGGREKNWTLGINWYATPTVRFMTNYIFVETDGGENLDPNILQLRGQVDF